MKAFGMIEVYGYLAAVEALDSALKAANVNLFQVICAKGGLVTVLFTGDVGAVQASADAASIAAGQVGNVLAVHVIARPAEEIERMLAGLFQGGPSPRFSRQPRPWRKQNGSRQLNREGELTEKEENGESTILEKKENVEPKVSDNRGNKESEVLENVKNRKSDSLEKARDMEPEIPKNTGNKESKALENAGNGECGASEKVENANPINLEKAKDVESEIPESAKKGEPEALENAGGQASVTLEGEGKRKKPGQNVPMDWRTYSDEQLHQLTVSELRSIVRSLATRSMTRREIRFGKKEELIAEIQKFCGQEG